MCSGEAKWDKGWRGGEGRSRLLLLTKAKWIAVVKAGQSPERVVVNGVSESSELERGDGLEVKKLDLFVFQIEKKREEMRNKKGEDKDERWGEGDAEVGGGGEAGSATSPPRVLTLSFVRVSPFLLSLGRMSPPQSLKKCKINCCS